MREVVLDGRVEVLVLHKKHDGGGDPALSSTRRDRKQSSGTLTLQERCGDCGKRKLVRVGLEMQVIEHHVARSLPFLELLQLSERDGAEIGVDVHQVQPLLHAANIAEAADDLLVSFGYCFILLEHFLQGDNGAVLSILGCKT